MVDDHPVFRTGLKGVIERGGNYKVVGETGTAKEALRLIRQFEPDIAVVDLTLKGANGIALTAEIVRSFENTQVMIISVHNNVDMVVNSIKAGAKGYVLKESDSDCILKCLKVVSEGKQFIDNSLSQRFCDWFTNLEAPIHEVTYTNLTKREQEILRLIAENHTSKEIAEKLGISPKTAETHRYNLMKKLGLKNKIALAQYAASVGIIDINQWVNGDGLG